MVEDQNSERWYTQKNENVITIVVTWLIVNVIVVGTDDEIDYAIFRPTSCI